MSSSALDALSAQREWLDRRLATGERVVGIKTALLAPAAQQRMGASGPVWGWLTDAMELADGAEFDCRSQLRTKAEPEIVFTLGEDLVGPGVTEVEVLHATSAIRAGIELPGSLLPTAPASVEEFVADNTSAGRFVLGAPLIDFAHLDLQLLGVLLECDGDVIASGAGARVMGNPARAVAWLANALARVGAELHAGMLVFTGAVADPIDVLPGHVISAEFAHLGRVGFTAT